MLAFHRQHFQGDPEMRRLHGDQYRGAISLNLVACPGSSNVVLCGHENRASLGIAEKMGTRLVIQEEAVVGSPVQYRLPAASDNRDVECFDLHLLQHLHTSSCRLNTSIINKAYGFRMSFSELEDVEAAPSVQRRGLHEVRPARGSYKSSIVHFCNGTEKQFIMQHDCSRFKYTQWHQNAGAEKE